MNPERLAVEKASRHISDEEANLRWDSLELLITLRLGHINERDVFPIFTEHPRDEFDRISAMKDLLSLDIPTVNGRTWGESFGDTIRSDSPDTEEAAMSQIGYDELIATMKQIPPREAKAFILRHFLGLELNEVRTQMSLNNHQHAHALADRGRAKMRKLLQNGK